MLIGAFVAAPVLARDWRTGTFRYAWTLGVGRRRWTLAKLVPLAVTPAIATGLFQPAVLWYYQPGSRRRQQIRSTHRCSA